MDYYLTPERLEELKRELEELKTTRRLEVANRLNRAKELGDLSENSEYQEARREQEEVESRIFELDQVVRNAKLFEMTTGGGEVQIGSTVHVVKDGTDRKFTIVGSKEVKPEDGKISNESPIGKALLGQRVGGTVTAKTPSGEATYKITKIE